LPPPKRRPGEPVLHLDWRFFPVSDAFDPGSYYASRYDAPLVATSIIVAILAAFVALSIAERIAAAKSLRDRWAWTSVGAVVMGGGIWSMHFVAELAFSLPCGVSYNAIGTILSMVPGILASGVALFVISQTTRPSLTRLVGGAVLMGAGIGTMHYSGMAAMLPEALLRYDPAWVAVSIVTAVGLAFVSLSIRFRFRWSEAASVRTRVVAAAVMGCAVAGMHYTAMRASLFYPLPDAPKLAMAVTPTALAVMITIFTVLVAVSMLIATFAGRQTELAATLREEITARKRSQEELVHARQQAEAANLAKSQFLATMSHEIRTPLNGVIGMATLLAATPLSDRQAQLVGNLAQSGQNLLALINDILDFSKIEAGRLDLFNVAFEPREVVAEVTDLFGEQCSGKGLELIYFIAEDVPSHLLGDPVRLRQVLINLVGNALKFTERGEVLINVSVDRLDDGELTLAFSVQDTGIGIAPDKQSQVFDSFRQADDSMTRSRGGSGLGLAITKRLVELQGGEIGVESEIGRGSRFFFTAHFGFPEEIGEPFRAVRHIDRKLRALLVDTNKVSGDVIRQYLAGWKIETTAVNTMRDAEAAWNEAVGSGHGFNVALIDVKGLGAAGIDLARTIRSDRREPCAEVILLVGMDSLAADDAIDQLGAFAILTKPARPSALFDCLVSIASGAGARGGTPFLMRHNTHAAHPRFDADVLVVEDNAVNRDVATGILESMDCRVATACNGQRALRAFEQKRFDLILMDCEMPVMDGFEAAARIREVETRAAASAAGDPPPTHTPIIALTAHALAEVRERCLASGMDDFLVKPFDELQLSEKLRRWVATRPERAAPEDGPAEPVIDLAAIDKIRAIPAKNGTSLFERVVVQFAATAPPLAADIRAKCAAGDAEGLWRAAHSLKSSAAALGAKPLARRCAEIEALARESGTAPVEELVDALCGELAAAQRGLNELIEAVHEPA
jgi:signal transduction histidine kinase/CheY-like chemotaxis protein/HPt (histidine-containing phosphotransfer) domain-containing protein